MKLEEFDYYLPKKLIAQTPIKDRAMSKLLILNKKNGHILHKKFVDIVDFISPGDCLVLNDTKVIPARLYGLRKDTGGKIEFVLLKKSCKNIWEVLVKPGKRAKIGKKFIFGDGCLEAKILDKTSYGGRIVEFYFEGDFEQILDKIGKMPIPPYIKKELQDKNRYQTVYASRLGSAAAPTAGLHFTEDLLKKLKDKGVNIVFITLHVGLGTFRPVKEENVEDHKMHAEYYDISTEAAKKINETKSKGGKIIAVGTTSTRTLETASDADGFIEAKNGWTDIFIYPGYDFKIVDGLITNFHLPKSTLLMLVCAFAGKNNIFKAYKDAISKNYRFFSFGDAMFII